MTPREPLPNIEDWAARLDLRNRSGEYVGPCPVCGGTDRFHVGRGRGGAMVGCRGCIDGQPEDVRHKAFGRVLREAFPERFQSGAGERTARTPNPPRKPPESRSEPVSAPDPGEDARIRCRCALWAAAAPADDSPGRVYLAGRWAWPGSDVPGAPALPASVRRRCGGRYARAASCRRARGRFRRAARGWRRRRPGRGRTRATCDRGERAIVLDRVVRDRCRSNRCPGRMADGARGDSRVRRRRGSRGSGPRRMD